MTEDEDLKKSLLSKFDEIDANGDGELDVREIKQALQSIVEKQSTKAFAETESHAKNYIDSVIKTFEETRILVDDPENP